MRIASKLAILLIVGMVLMIGLGGVITYTSVTKASDELKPKLKEITTEAVGKTSDETLKAVVQKDYNFLYAYIANRRIKTLQQLANDYAVFEALTRPWYKEEFSAVYAVEGDRIIIVVYPNEAWVLETPESAGLDKLEPSYYEALKKAAKLSPNQQLLVDYEIEKGKKKRGIFYATNIKLLDEQTNEKARLIIATSAYRESFIRDISDIFDKQNKAINEAIGHELSSIKKSILLSLLISALVIAAIFYFSTKEIALPLVRLSEVSNKIADGDIDAEVPYQNRDDEIGTLSKAIERLRRSLKIAMETLEQFT